MSATLFCAQWYRVARVRPRLRAQVRVQRQHWRDQRWYLLSDALTGRQHRINEAAFQFIGRCDGRRTVHEVWSAVLESQPDAAPTQDEVLLLLGQLNEMELLHSERAADPQTLLQRRAERAKQRRRSLLNPFSFRLPLGDPSAWLTRLDPLAQLLFRPAGAWLWLLAMLFTALVAATEWPALRSHAALNWLGGNHAANLLWLWLLYPVIKALHELGHALAVRRWGGEVHEVGLALMLLVPAPYVDASAASSFTRRQQRAAVGAAGLLVELALAALGFWVWLLTQPGTVHDIGFAVLVIGAGSSLLFNGNPLLRFDAYHVLCDLFDIPNLAPRSNAWWGHHLGRYLLGSASEQPAHAASERKWLWAYAPLSLAYRLVLALAMVLWLGGQWLLLGLAAALYMLVTMLLQPVLGWARQALASTQPGRAQARMRVRLVVLAGAVGLAVCVLPVPLSSTAPAVVWLPDEAQVRAEVDGFIKALPVPDGARVRPGTLLVQLENPELLSQREQLASRLEGLQVEQFQQLLQDPSATQNLALDLARVQSELERLDQRIAQLQVRATAAGTLSMPLQSDLLGTFKKHGVVLGHVLAPGALRVRAAVAEADAFLVQTHVASAQVRLSDTPEQALPATLGTRTPSATRQLPSAALGDRSGGPFASDPSDSTGQRSLESVYVIDLTLPAHSLERVGGRAWVRFDHGTEPLAVQAWRRAAQLFLQHFSPAA